MAKFYKAALIGCLLLVFAGTAAEAQSSSYLYRHWKQVQRQSNQADSPWYNPYAYDWRKYNLRDH